jgi:hypothetical protein
MSRGRIFMFRVNTPSKTQICTLPALGGERCAKFFAAVPERVFVDADNGDIDNDEADEVKPGGAQCYDFVNAKKC